MKGDDDMKFKVYRTSDSPCSDLEEIEINTLEELLDFCKECHEHIIITEANRWNDWTWNIEIYDDYRE